MELNVRKTIQIEAAPTSVIGTLDLMKNLLGYQSRADVIEMLLVEYFKFNTEPKIFAETYENLKKMEVTPKRKRGRPTNS